MTEIEQEPVVYQLQWPVPSGIGGYNQFDDIVYTKLIEATAAALEQAKWRKDQFSPNSIVAVLEKGKRVIIYIESPEQPDEIIEIVELRVR